MDCLREKVDELEKEEEQQLDQETEEIPLGKEQMDRLMAFRNYMFTEDNEEFKEVLQKIADVIEEVKEVDDDNISDKRSEQSKFFYRGVLVDTKGIECGSEEDDDLVEEV